MTKRSTRRVAVATAIVLALGLGAGTAAYAYWRAGGTGAGSGATGTTVALTISAGTPSSALYPGGQTNVVATVSNPNYSPIHLTALSLDTTQGTGGFTVDAGHSGCSVAALSYSTQTNGGSGWTVPSRVGAINGSLSVTLTNALSLSSSAANACQGATFTVYLAAS